MIVIAMAPQQLFPAVAYLSEDDQGQKHLLITGSSEFERVQRVHLRSFHNFPQPDMLQPTDKLQRIEINILCQPEKSCRFNDRNSDHNGDELSTSTQFAY